MLQADSLTLTWAAIKLNIVAIETSTEACSVALLRDDGEIFSEFDMTPRQHTRYLPQMLDAVYDRAQLSRMDTDYIAYSSGPGAFTGVRIAAATAQGLSIGLTAPLIPISTLAVLAQHACELYAVDRVMSALDARMGETYCAEYIKNAQGLVELQGEERLIKLDLLEITDHMAGAGSGFSASMQAGKVFDSQLQIYPEVYPAASALVKLAHHAAGLNQVVEIGHAQINYIRNQVAEKKSTPTVSF